MRSDNPRSRERPSSTTPLIPSVYEIDVVAPYRLDLTVSVLRRLPTNIVDVFTAEGQYIRALGGLRAPVIARVIQERADVLRVTFEGGDSRAGGHLRELAVLRRILGVDRELSHFYRAVRRIPWLHPLATRMIGVKPPRYPTLWEACVNAIVFQQVSLVAASSISRRIVETLGVPIESGASRLYMFPTVECLQGASDVVLSATGLSANKLAALHRVAEALLTGQLDEARLEELPSPDAVMLLCRIKGIGPWTAAVILLRGLGRLDVFPMNDSSVVRNLELVGGADVDHVLRLLGPQRGMLYYHLLLARLTERGYIGVPDTRAAPGASAVAKST